MFAIKLSIENIDTILVESPVDVTELQSMAMEYDGESVYFVPRHDEAPSADVLPDSQSWMTIPELYLKTHYDYDSEKIDTEFVELTPK